MFHLLDAINAAAKAHQPRSAPRSAVQGTLAPVQQAFEGPTLELVISVLSDLFANLPLETTASRRGVTMAFVRALLDGLNPAISRVLGDAIPDASLLTDAQALAMTLSICNHLNIKFSRLSNSRWNHSQKLASNCGTAELLQLSNAWLDLAHFGNVNTPPSQATADFVRGLHLLGIPVHRITIRINPNPKDETAVLARSTNFLKQQFHTRFGAAPQFDKNKPRRGRSGLNGRHPMYLQILTRDLKPGEIASPALNDTQTFSALMLAVLAYINIKSKE
jgi:hypothetical protein